MPDTVEIPATLTIAQADMPDAPPPAIARDVVHVASAQALLKAPAASAAVLRGYHEGSILGGGTYIYQPGEGGPRIGPWVLQPGQTVTPYHFGAGERGWGADYGKELQAFFGFCGSAAARHYPIYGTGNYGTTIPLVAENMIRTYGFDLGIQGLAPMDDVLTIRSARRGVWVGKIHIRVTPHQTPSSRYAVNGVRIEDASRATLCNFVCDRGAGWGVYFAGDANMCRIGDVSVTDMGVTNDPNRRHTVESIGYSNHERNTIHQRTTIMLSEGSRIPSAAHQMQRAFWISATGYPYKILSVDREAHSITVYPMIPDAEQVNEAHGLVYGGGVCCYSGGHTAKAKIGHVYPMRAGTGIWLTGSSSAAVDGYTGQFCGVDIALGRDPHGAFGGAFFGSVYFEGSRVADMVHVNQTTSFSNGTLFGSVTSLNMDKWVSLLPKRAYGEVRWERQYLPISMMREGQWWSPDAGARRDHDSSSYTMSGSHRTKDATHGQPTRNNTEIRLRADPSIERFKGVHPATFHLYGQRGNNGNYHSSVPVTCDEGYTINGKPGPLTLKRRDVPVTLYALLEGDNNWIVTLQQHEMPEPG